MAGGREDVLVSILEWVYLGNEVVLLDIALESGVVIGLEEDAKA